MKRLIQLSFAMLLCSQAFGQLLLKVPGVTPDKVCVPDTVYFMMGNKAKPVDTYDTIEARLNREVKYAKNNPEFKASVSIQGAVNCKGEPGGGLHIVNSSGNEQLDKQLLAFLAKVDKWKPAKLKGKNVDSWVMWNIEIAKGFIDIGNR